MKSDSLISPQNPHVYWHSGFFVASCDITGNHDIPSKSWCLGDEGDDSDELDGDGEAESGHVLET